MNRQLDVKINLNNDNICIISIKGELSIFVPEFSSIYKEILEYLSNDIFKFILDMDEVTYVDSSGVGLIMRLATNANKYETNICVICSQPQVLKVIKVSNIDKIIHFINTIEEGIQYFG